MKKLFAVMLAAVCIASAALLGFATYEKALALDFTDVKNDDSAMSIAIYKLVDAGVVEGYGDGSFGPQNTLTRAQFCKMTNLIFGYTEMGTDGFPDVTSDLWYYEYAMIAKKAGYIEGYEDGTFRGDLPVTREQVCAIVCRCAGLMKLGDVTVNDRVSEWAKDYVSTMVSNNLMSLETGNTFRAQENMKRGESSVVLSLFIKKPDETTAAPVTTKKPSVTTTEAPEDSSSVTTVTTAVTTAAKSEEEIKVIREIGNAIEQLSAASESEYEFNDSELEVIGIIIETMQSVIDDSEDNTIDQDYVEINYGDAISSAKDIYKGWNEDEKGDYEYKMISLLQRETYKVLKNYFM